MKKFFRDVKKYFKYVIFAGQTELKAEVANSYLNWLWWIIEPICFMFIYSFVFGFLFGAKEAHFNIFVYIGITMWDFFNRMLTSSVQVVRNNKAIVSKVYIPKYMLIFIKMYVNAFKMFVAFILMFIMMAVTRVPFTLQILWLIPIVLTLFCITFAICSILLHFGVFVDDLANVVKIFLRMMFYLTGVFYNLSDKVGSVLGEKWAILIGHLNPMASLITDMRLALLNGTMPDIKFTAVWFVLGILVSMLGIRLIYKNENSYVKVI